MRNRKIPGNVMLLLILGLLAIVVPRVLHLFLEVPDVLIGILMGAGVGILLVALTKMKRGY